MPNLDDIACNVADAFDTMREKLHDAFDNKAMRRLAGRRTDEEIYALKNGITVAQQRELETKALGAEANAYLRAAQHANAAAKQAPKP